MKIIKLTAILILFFLTSTAQNRNSAHRVYPPSIKEGNELDRRQLCQYRNNYSIKKRLNFYPFNKDYKVVLISFEWPDVISSGIREPNSSRHTDEHQDTIPNLNSIDAREKFYKSIEIERQTLSPSGINKLTNILYNFGYTSTRPYHGLLFYENGARCYDPKNAILFFDQNNKLVEFIEICFECHRREVSSDNIILGEFCTQKYDMIKRFFRNVGIIY